MRGKHGPMSGISEAGSAEAFTGRTAWARDMAAALRAYLQTEVGSAVVLLAAAVVGLIWANLPGGSYETVWTTRLAVRLGGWGITEELRRWVNDGLMTFFFFVIGLEVRRELDMGELRERRRVAVPVLAALGGMVAPALIYLAINAGGPGARAWGVPMPTDTALALGVLALVGPRFPQRLRVFVLTLVVVDDIASLVVIGVAYTRDLSLVALAIAILFFGVVYLLRFLRFWRGPAYFVVGVALWAAMLESGVHPAVAGVAMGLLATAYPPRRQRLERAVSLTRMFREQPTPEFARSARLSVDAAISTNERLQYLLHPWTSYVIVPLFALANVGVVLRGDLLRSAIGSPITMGVVAGIGFTVSLFIADLSLDGPRLEEAKIGILGASIVASLLGWGTFRAIARLPRGLLVRTAAATAPLPDELAAAVDAERDHVRGPEEAPVTLVEYGDYECPYCGRAEPTVRELLQEFSEELRYVYRHLPLVDVHPHAELAAEAAEAAGAQGSFWEMHDLLFANQNALEPADLRGYAARLGLDVDRFWDEARSRTYARRVAEDVRSADESGVAGTPTFFVNGRRHEGAYDTETLAAAVRLARHRAKVDAAASRARQSR